MEWGIVIPYGPQCPQHRTEGHPKLINDRQSWAGLSTGRAVIHLAPKSAVTEPWTSLCLGTQQAEHILVRGVGWGPAGGGGFIPFSAKMCTLFLAYNLLAMNPL